jgi:hypothetical protein
LRRSTLVPSVTALERRKSPAQLARLKGHDVVEHLARREGHTQRIEVTAGRRDAVPVRDVDLVNLGPGPVSSASKVPPLCA